MNIILKGISLLSRFIFYGLIFFILLVIIFAPLSLIPSGVMLISLITSYLLIIAVLFTTFYLGFKLPKLISNKKLQNQKV